MKLFYGNLSPLKKIVSILFIFAFFSVCIDAYLIHRTYVYFGGGALNRIFTLSEVSEFIEYFILAFAYDVIVLGFIVYLLSLMFMKLSILKTHQIYYGAFSYTFFLYFFYTVFSMGVASYFGGHFDLSILLELTNNNLSNIFSFISQKQLIILLLVLSVPLLNILAIFILRDNILLRKLFPKKLRGFFIKICVLVIVLSISHFLIIKQQNLAYGLSNKFSYALLNSTLSLLFDFDQDGYSLLTSPQDPDNFDSSVGPYSIEVVGNGLDENNLAGDLSPQTFNALNEQNSFSFNSPLNKNVIVIIVETFRSDVIRQKINGKMIMPFLSKLSNDVAYTPYAYSNFGVTARAIQTVFMGSMHYNTNTKSLFDYFRTSGYSLLGFSAQSESWGGTDNIFSFNEFDSYFDARNKKWKDNEISNYDKMKGTLATIDSTELNDKIFEGIEQYKNVPFFMYINYQDLHYPYHKDSWDKIFITEGFINAEFFSKKNQENIFLQYANAANHLDTSFENLIGKLKKEGLYDNTVIVIIGDHPDSFYENGILGHSWTLDKYQRQTPLIVINGSGQYEVPIGQDELANIILNSAQNNSALEAEFILNYDKEVFELTGLLSKPRQIGYIGTDRLTQYDFKTNVFTAGNVEYNAKSIKENHELYTTFTNLINKWETEVLLQKTLEK